MPFISFSFLVFLPLFFAAYWGLRKNLLWQNVLVISGSYIFYGWADWRYTFLLAGYTLVSFLSGLLLERTDNPLRRKLILWVTIVLNIGVLGLYKYYDFFIVNFNRAFTRLGFEADWPTLNLILPIGISFFTFQALSYTIDVYRRRFTPTHNAVSFFAFLSFFPQMIAGPIERADQLLPQFEKKRRFNYDSAVYGMKRILWGLFKKMVIADNCAAIVNNVFFNADTVGSGDLWIGAIFFSMQIYGDFSGYSDIAVGCGRLLGIRLTENFRMPYFARNIREFWHRWHISLTRWLTDYIYIPLGGNRKGLVLTLLNIFIVFGISGIWHGAELSYIAWGLYHGALMAAMVIVGLIAAHNSLKAAHHSSSSPVMDRAATHPWLSKIASGAGIAATFMLVMLGFVMFRSHSVIVGLRYIRRMFLFTGGEPITIYELGMTTTLVVIFLIIEWIGRTRSCPICVGDRGIFRHRAVRVAWYYLLTMTVIVFRGGESPFIYFQF